MGELNEDRPLAEEEPNDKQDCTDDEARGAGAEAIQAEPCVKGGGDNQKNVWKEYQEENAGWKQGNEAGAFAVFLLGPF